MHHVSIIAELFFLSGTGRRRSTSRASETSGPITASAAGTLRSSTSPRSSNTRKTSDFTNQIGDSGLQTLKRLIG